MVDVTVNRTLLIQQWHETRLEDLVAVKLEEVQRRFIEAPHVQYHATHLAGRAGPDPAAWAS